jgi:hypothetical protein
LFNILNPNTTLKHFANGDREEQTITFPELIGNSFTVPDQKYELDEDYAGSVFNQFHQGKIQD